MLAKKYKLPIQQLYEENHNQTNAKRQYSQAVKKNSFFVVKTHKSKLPYSRFGVVVGSKVNKLASGRNFIRRVIFHWIQSTNINKQPGKDVMIIVLPNIRALNKKNEIYDELSKMF